MTTLPRPFTPTQWRPWREARGLTQAQLADLVGVSTSAVGLWESGASRITAPLWELFCIKAGWHPRYGERMGYRHEERAALLEDLSALIERTAA